MYFLCPKHRLELIQLPELEISSRWFDWMCQAGEFYELRLWNKATPFAGCAMDLASYALLRHDIKGKSLATHATLAGIYATNLLQHQSESEKASKCTESLSQRILIALNSTDKEWAQTCVNALFDPQSQLTFFKTYLNLPIELTGNATAHRHQTSLALH